MTTNTLFENQKRMHAEGAYGYIHSQIPNFILRVLLICI